VHNLVVRENTLLHMQSTALDRGSRLSIRVFRVESSLDLVVVLFRSGKKERIKRKVSIFVADCDT
jgi:hypothetical protein